MVRWAASSVRRATGSFTAPVLACMVWALSLISWTASAMARRLSFVAQRAHDQARGAAQAALGEVAVGARVDRVLDRRLVRAGLEAARQIEDLQRLVGAFRARAGDLF